jgi:hypothetical protein
MIVDSNLYLDLYSYHSKKVLLVKINLRQPMDQPKVITEKIQYNFKVWHKSVKTSYRDKRKNLV